MGGGLVGDFQSHFMVGLRTHFAGAGVAAIRYKYSLGLVPLIVFGIGVWNLKKWAVWGVIAVAVADLVFFIFNLQTLNAFTIESEVFVFSTILSGIALLCNGPVGDILILLAAPSLIKALKESA